MTALRLPSFQLSFIHFRQIFTGRHGEATANMDQDVCQRRVRRRASGRLGILSRECRCERRRDVSELLAGAVGEGTAEGGVLAGEVYLDPAPLARAGFHSETSCTCINFTGIPACTPVLQTCFHQIRLSCAGSVDILDRATALSLLAKLLRLALDVLDAQSSMHFTALSLANKIIDICVVEQTHQPWSAREGSSTEKQVSCRVPQVFFNCGVCESDKVVVKLLMLNKQLRVVT